MTTDKAIRVLNALFPEGFVDWAEAVRLVKATEAALEEPELGIGKEMTIQEDTQVATNGHAKPLTLTRVESAILKALEGGPLGPKAIAKAIGTHPQTIYPALRTLPLKKSGKGRGVKYEL